MRPAARRIRTSPTPRMRPPRPPRFRSFFTAKTSRDIEATHAHFHPGKIVYVDATLGWAIRANADVRKIWEQYMPQWPAGAKSYPTQIRGDMTSAVVFVTDTPELFGGEIRTISIAGRGVSARGQAIESQLDGLPAADRDELLSLIERLLRAQARPRDEGDVACRLCDWSLCLPDCPMDHYASGAGEQAAPAPGQAQPGGC